jgi:dTDP-glucose 4,6-dehydratase
MASGHSIVWGNPVELSAALKGGPIVLLSDGGPTRSFCYVRDFIIGSLGVLVRGKPAEPYNVGNPEERSMLDVARLMAEIAGHSSSTRAMTPNTWSTIHTAGVRI